MSFLDALDGTCAATPAKNIALSAAEACWVEALSAQCSPANDCLARCLSSGQAREIGGGCWHVCFPNASAYASWQEPAGSARCGALGRVDGV